MDAIEHLAQKIADDLFTTGLQEGYKADRLVLWQDRGRRDLGGWSESAATQRIANILREAGVRIESR